MGSCNTSQHAAECLDLVAAREDDPRSFPSTLVVLAHPDDETVAFGARLARYRHATFLYVTDGAPQDGIDAAAHGFGTLESYRAARRGELQRVFDLAGLSGGQIRELGIPDQQASLRMCWETQQIRRLLDELQPDVLLTHPYEGGHPDHDACAFASRAALDLLRSSQRPVLVEAACYHAGASGIESHCFLSETLQPAPPTPVVKALSAGEQETKQRRLACFTTQEQTLRTLISNTSQVEQFRVAPRYRFDAPPHAGELLYERNQWGMDGMRFRVLASEALRELELNSTPEQIEQCP